MIDLFQPAAWFWIVGGDESRAWSSAAAAYVSAWPPKRVTRIASEAELNEVLRSYGLAIPAPEMVDYQISIQSHIDATAKSKGYADGVAIAGYSTSTIPTWSEEAAAFIAWRDQVWVYAYTELAKVQGGHRAQPTINGLIAELPTIIWPGG